MSAKNPFRAKAEALRTISEGLIEKIALRVIKANEDYAIELNLDQLDKGRDRIGVPLPQYTPAYRKRKKKLTGKDRRNPDLYLTGDFWRKFTVVVADGFPIRITSTDTKTEDLVSRYGENIFGLSEVNTKKFAAFVKPLILKEIEIEIKKALRVR